jgi:hypothetical protein
MSELSGYGLGVVATGAVYALLVVGLLRLRWLRLVDPGNPTAVYRKLERVLGRVYPNTQGDTLRELLDRARQKYPEFNWKELEREFDEYEAYRYGGRPKPKSLEETLKFANSIRSRKE